MPNQPVFGTLYTLDSFVYRQNSTLLYCTIKEIIILKIACFGVIYVPFSRVITRYNVYFFTWVTIQHSFSTIYILTDVFFTCVTGLCVLYKHGGHGGKGPNNFFRGRPPSQPLPPLVVCTGLMCCMYWTICSCLTVPATS